jgi:DUF3037 family protein
MPSVSNLKACSFFLVRYVPDLTREEFLNIGLFLHNPEEKFLDCCFTDDVPRIRRFHPHADTEFLRELQPFFEEQIHEHENDLDGYLQEMQESFSNLIQLTPPRPCLTSEPQAEMQKLFDRYVGARLAGPLPQDTRMRIKQRLTDALRQQGVLEHPRLETRIPADRWTPKGDPFKFDFGYLPAEAAGKPNGQIKLIHALSLTRDDEIAAKLANTIGYVRKKEPAKLTAVVERLPAPVDEIASHSLRILQDAAISIQPLDGIHSFAQSVRTELGA